MHTIISHFIIYKKQTQLCGGDVKMATVVLKINCQGGSGVNLGEKVEWEKYDHGSSVSSGALI